MLVKYANYVETIEIVNLDHLCTPLAKDVRFDPESITLILGRIAQDNNIRCEATAGIIRTYPGLNGHEARGVLTFQVDIDWDVYGALQEKEVSGA